MPPLGMNELTGTDRAPVTNEGKELGGGLWDYAKKTESILSKLRRERAERDATSRSMHGTGTIKLDSMHLDKFDGECRWEEYVSHLEGCYAWNQWSDEEAAHALRIALLGEAATYITSIAGYYCMDLDQVVENFQRHFGRPKNHMADKRRLRE